MPFFCDLIFSPTRVIKSLPPWPGPRWHGLLRLAARAAGLGLDEVLLGLVPERWGTRPWAPGEPARLRLIAEPQRYPALAGLVRVLASGQLVGEGEFTAGGSLKLLGLEWPGRRPSPPAAEALADFIAGRAGPSELDLNALMPELAALEQSTASTWRLEFTAPLRLTRTGSDPGRGQYAGSDFFQDPAGLSRLLAKLRWVGPATARPPEPPRVIKSQIHWEPFNYNRERQVRLGGLLGVLHLTGRPDFETARRLVLGQYLGAGKNPRFGCGFFRLPDLDPVRPWPLFPARTSTT